MRAFDNPKGPEISREYYGSLWCPTEEAIRKLSTLHLVATDTYMELYREKRGDSWLIAYKDESGNTDYSDIYWLQLIELRCRSFNTEYYY